ncbi:MAG: 1-aminocyclopropane-1-carboxylate deaminase [Rhodospirillaceae bacterium]|nr:1-aminocyclopropane-1-carboxylate deaminase [Rhodospirillaceae bacterium]
MSPFMVMDVLNAANQRELSGEAVYHLEIGQPGTGAPKGVVDAVREPLQTQKLGYTDAFGIDPLREAISAHYSRFYGADVPAERIAVTSGSSAGFVLSFLAAFDAGDRVALAAPDYPCYRHILNAFGIEPIIVETDIEDRFQPTPKRLAPLLPLDGLIVASPSNPTGTMLSSDDLLALSVFCQSEGIRLISDEIYHGITYDVPAATAAAINPDAVVINSFSKYFSMTGWRVGWMVVPEELLRPVECLQQNLFICAPALSQLAACAAFDCRDELEGLVTRYRENRSLLLKRLPEAGFAKLAPADGAFYIYADVSDRTDDSERLCREILDQSGVALTPGLDFDSARGHRYVRISYAEAPETISAAMEHLINWAS